MVAHVSEAENHGSVYQQSDDVDSDVETLGIRVPEYTLKVFSPRKICSMRGDYTSYGISIQTTSSFFRLTRSKTRRRFSEFDWLRKELDKTDNWRRPPALPSKRFWNLFDAKFLETRRHHLQQWLHDVLSEPCYLSNVALHLFLQTEMTVEQIKDYLNGKISEQRVEEIWSNHGKLYHYQAYNLLHNNFREEPMEIHYSPKGDLATPTTHSTQLAADTLPAQEPATGTHTESTRRSPDHPSPADFAGQMGAKSSQRSEASLSMEELAIETHAEPLSRSLDRPSLAAFATEASTEASQCELYRPLQEESATKREASLSSSPSDEHISGFRHGRNMSPDSGYQDEQLVQASSSSSAAATTTTTTTTVKVGAHDVSGSRQIYSINGD